MSENEKFSIEQINNIQKYVIEVGKNLKELHMRISKYNEELDKENFPATLKLLPKITSKINDLNKILKENNEIKINYLENEISEINTWMNKQKDLELQKNKKIKYKEFFLNNLYEKSKSKNLEVQGRFPDFHCNNFKLKLDERKFSIKLLYGGDQEKMKVFEDWNLENILNYIYNFYEFLKKINLENELKQIHESYMNCLKNKESGVEWVPIVDILSEYTKIKQNTNNQLIYPERILFSSLIYRISENPELRVIGEKITRRTATHTASGKSNEHLWIPTKTNDLIGENIMYLSFKKDIN
jgi:hypothetical protein